MIKSDNINELAAALCKFQGGVKAASMGGKNPFFKSKYSTLNELVETAKPHLLKYGLSITQLINTDSITTMLLHDSGQYIATDTYLPIDENNRNSKTQIFGISITYIRRYSYAAILGLVSDEDNDGNLPKSNQNEAPEQPQKPWLNKNTDEYTKAIEFIKGGGTLAQIRKKYAVNKDIAKELEAITKIESIKQ